MMRPSMNKPVTAYAIDACPLRTHEQPADTELGFGRSLVLQRQRLESLALGLSIAMNGDTQWRLPPINAHAPDMLCPLFCR